MVKTAKSRENGTKVAAGVVLAGAVGARADYARTKWVRAIPDPSLSSADSFISNPPDYLEESVGDVIGKKHAKVRQSRGSSADSSLRRQSIGSQSGKSRSYDPLQQSFVNEGEQSYGSWVSE